MPAWLKLTVQDIRSEILCCLQASCCELHHANQTSIRHKHGCFFTYSNHCLPRLSAPIHCAAYQLNHKVTMHTSSLWCLVGLSTVCTKTA